MTRRPFPTAFRAGALACALVLCAATGLAMGPRPGAAPQANATENATDNATGNATGNKTGPSGRKAVPDDASALAQYQVLREYFQWQVTLDDRLPGLFSRRVREEETMAFLTARETVNRRGQLERFRSATVDISGLVFTRITGDPDLARIHVTGSYTFSVPPVVQTVEEDALFVLLPEMGQWRIYERRPDWR